MRELLPLVPKPTRYLGIEEGAVHKQRNAVSLHVALAFPDMYEVGMSYLGQKILYGIINQRENWWAERVFTPCVETAAVLRSHGTPLATLESDTPLHRMHLLGFHVTHELCYTNVLYMLDLGGIPLRSKDRGDSLETPVIMAGGGCTLAAEPLAPFMDLMALGEGEELMVELLELLSQCREQGVSRQDFLLRAAAIPGVYVPSFFQPQNSDGSDGYAKPLVPVRPDIPVPARRVVPDMNTAPFPVVQPVPFGAVHSRLALEIGRGCTRGCRFCQAGIIYRPARERSVEALEGILHKALSATGYDELSFLSLSTGDFSALKTLFTRTVDRCSEEQISVSLPSLRVGSIDDDIMARMAGIRRTGATLAPEAGSQRLRDVINKGVTEEQLLLHVRKLFQHGWQQVKLYFMIGLPTETDADLDAIVDLCRKVRGAAGYVKRLNVTASISPFVPKAHTPFQWEAQIPLAEIRRRIGYLRDAFAREKSMRMRWHEPDSSALEGIFSRGDRRLADVVETAYRKGAVFSSWMEHFALAPYLESLAEHGLTYEEYIAERDVQDPLPWDHINSGVSREFLQKERERAYEMAVTDDCRYAGCRLCGACDVGKKPSLLDRLTPQTTYANILNFPERDQQAHQPETDDRGNVLQTAGESNKPPQLAAELGHKAAHYRIWYSKEGPATFLSQLELQAVFERIFRRARLPMTFSQGFHPLPLISFGKALPVGVASRAEWVNIFLREDMPAQDLFHAIATGFPRGMVPTRIQRLDMGKRQSQAIAEDFLLEYTGPAERRQEFQNALAAFRQSDSQIWTRETKKGERTVDIRPIFHKISEETEEGTMLTLDWSSTYVSPLKLVLAALPGFGLLDLRLTKTAQHMD